jgi:hypothetical protein
MLITDLHRELQGARVPEVDFALVTGYANQLDIVSFIRKMLALVLMEKDLVDNKAPTTLAQLAAFGQSNAEHKAEFLANAGLIHLYRQHDLAAAQNILSQLQAMAQSGDVMAAEHVKFFGRIIEDYKMHQSMGKAGSEKRILASDQAITPPMTTVLAQNYPNPFNPTTAIHFALPHAGKVTLSIFNVLGEQVRILVDEIKPAGQYTVVWDGKNIEGETVASGIYIYQLSYQSAEPSASPIVRSGKMSLLR